ncbi:MAG TPA: HIG1 domain-containing protein [Allosphingosinicella sp.]|jgi:hypothetical protein
MQLLLIVALAAAAAATLYALVRGVIGMANGSGQLASARSQSLMQKRVAYQAIAILVAGVIMAAGRA